MVQASADLDGPPVAPALTNAIFAAMGKRIRTPLIGNQLARA